MARVFYYLLLIFVTTTNCSSYQTNDSKESLSPQVSAVWTWQNNSLQAQTTGWTVSENRQVRFDDARFQVLRVVLTKIQIFWDMTSCRLVQRYWCFDGAYWPHHHGHSAQHLRVSCKTKGHSEPIEPNSKSPWNYQCGPPNSLTILTH